MNDVTALAALNRHARLAGFAYLAIIVVSILNGVFVDSALVVAGDADATAKNIRAGLGLFRFGLAVHLVMFAAVVFLAWALYVLFEAVDRRLALLGLLFRMAEAVVGAVSALAGLVAARPLDESARLAPFEAGEASRLLALGLEAREAGLAVAIFFLCLGTMVFCRLFLRSAYVPKALAVLGLVSFPFLLAGSLAGVLAPRLAGWAPLTFVAPALFEAGVGLWLLIKGAGAGAERVARAGELDTGRVGASECPPR